MFHKPITNPIQSKSISKISKVYTRHIHEWWSREYSSWFVNSIRGLYFDSFFFVCSLHIYPGYSNSQLKTKKNNPCERVKKYRSKKSHVIVKSSGIFRIIDEIYFDEMTARWAPTLSWLNFPCFFFVSVFLPKRIFVIRNWMQE